MLVKGLIDWSRSVAEYDEKAKVTRVFDMHTGDCIAIVGDDAHQQALPVELLEVVREDGSKILVQKGIANTESLLGVRSSVYNRLTADVICSRIAGGASLKKLSEEEHMPSYATLCRWRREHEEFQKALEQAEQDKAEYLAAKALEVAESADEFGIKQAEVAGKTLHVETLKWTAQVSKPKKFSPKVTHQGDATNPIRIVIETGIRRAGDPGFNVDETEKLKQARDITPALECSNLLGETVTPIVAEEKELVKSSSGDASQIETVASATNGDIE